MFLRKSLSVVLITRDEAELLSDCLASVSWADEIILLDAGSNDETCHIAMQAGARVFQSTNWLGFGKQRQLAQGYASSDYILMLDADERVTPQLQQDIMMVLQHPEPGTVYSFVRRNLFLGRFMRHSGWYPDRVVRLYEREEYNYNAMPVHESLDIRGAKILALQGDLMHLTCRDLPTFQRKQLQYAETWALEYYRQGRKCSFFAIISHTYSVFVNKWLLRAGFLDGKQGWLLAMVNAQYTFNKYAHLWVLSQPCREREHDL
ncbi:MAG: hypothetical protein FKGGLIKP_00687 [Sodalis sp. Fse]|nr:MAG: hypothetical protein FKGGLIKP_00687 [Sodalis sp. Fse]UVK79305.1 MAG: hypothetical protein IGNPGNKH_00797 [Sodalis sp. Ffu]